MSDAPDEPSNVEEGVDFGDLDQRLEAHGFPIDHDEFISEFGDYQLELNSGDDITIRELMRPLQGGDTYNDHSEIRQAMLNMMPEEAVGRKGYSDRGGDNPTETDAAEGVDETDTDPDTTRTSDGDGDDSDDSEDQSF